MKPFFKVSFIIAGCMVCIGLLFGVVGVVFGGHTQLVNMIENGEFSYGSDGFIYDVSGNRVSFFYDDSDIVWDEADNDGVTYDAADVTDMELQIGGGELKLVPYDGEKYKIIARNRNKYETSVHNGTLRVQTRDESTNRRDITVYVPKNYTLNQMRVTVGAGAVRMEELVCENLDVQVGAGAFEADELTANEVSLEIGAGSADIDSSRFGKTMFDVGLGSLRFDGAIEGDSEISCSMGSTNLDLDGDELDYNFNVSCGMGSVEIADYVFRGATEDGVIEHGGPYTFNVDCSMGSVVIDF